MGKHGRAARIGKRFALVLVGVAVFYLVSVNAILRTPLLRHFTNSDPESMRVEYKSAYSLYPFHGHVDGLTIRGRDRNVEWILTLDHGDFSVAAWQLLRKRFQATHVTADGLTFRARFRQEASANTPERVAALPPVPGFADPPLADPTPAPPPLSDKEYNLWAVQLSDIDIDHVREVWVDTIRYAGDGRVRGSWLFRPIRQLEIGPATADLRGLELSYGTRVLAADVRGTVNATVHTFDVRDPAAFLTHVSTDTDVHGTLPSFENLDAALHFPEVENVRGGGPVEVRLLADYGVLLPGTHVSIVSDATSLDSHGVSLAAKLRGAVDVVDDASGGKGPTARLKVSASELAIAARVGREDARASVAETSVTFSTPQRNVTAPLTDVTYAAEAHGAVVDHLERFGPLLSSIARVEVQSGSATADARVEGSFADRHARGELTFGLRRLAAKHEEERFVTDADGVVRMPDASLADGSVDLSGSEVTLRDASGEAHGLALHAPMVHARAARARIGREGSPDVEADVALTDLSTPDLRGVGALVHASDAFALTGGRASLTGKFHVSSRAHSLSGSATVTAEHAAARLHKYVVASPHVTAKVALRTLSWETGHVDLSGTDVTLHDLATRAAGAHTGPTLVGTLSARAPRFIVDHGAPSGSVVADLPDGFIADLRGLENAVPLPKGLFVDGGHARATAHMEIDLASRGATGRIQVRAEEAKVHVGKQIITGNLDASMLARADRVDRAIDVSGSAVVLTNVSSHGEGKPVDGWSARFDFRDAELKVAPVAFRAHLQAHAHDALPIAAMLGANADMPKWAEPTMRMSGVKCEADLAAAPALIDLRSFVAKGEDDVMVRLGYALRDNVPSGAVLVHVGKLSAGFNLDQGATNVILFGADSWFARQDASLEARLPLQK